jgi:PAS domain S-box-containing protein
MARRSRVWWYPRSSRARYGGAAALALASFLLLALLERWFGAPLLVIGLGAVAVAAIVAGPGPGRLAIAVVAAAWTAKEWPLAPEAAVRLALFLAVGLLVAHASGWARASSARLHAVRREAAHRLRSRLAFQRAIANAVDEGIFAVDERGRVTFLNAAAERSLGYRTGELLGKRLKEALRCTRADECGDDVCRVAAVMSTGRPFRAEDGHLTRKDGSWLPVRYSSAPIHRAGRVTGAVVAFQDVSAEQRAASRERFLAAATEQLATSIDLDETLARVVRLALPYLGDWCMVVLVEEGGAPRRVVVETKDPAIAPAAREMLAAYPIDLGAEHGVGRVLRTGESELLENVDPSELIEGPTGELRMAMLRKIGLRSLIAVPLRARGRLLGVIDFAIAKGRRRFDREDLADAEEIARRCALALDNARLHRKVQEAVRARDELLAVVSHDLRSPLGAIQVAARLVEQSAPSGAAGDPGRRSAALIERASARMGRLVEDLLDLASVESGRLSMTQVPLRPGEIAEEAADAIRLLAAEAGVDVAVQPRTVTAAVAGDRGRVQQVLSNLLSNAVGMTPAGGCVCVGYRQRGGHVVFSVADSGPGIPSEDRRRIFERFWRGPDARYRGSGLGLAISRAIVEAHGGRIWAGTGRSRAGAVFRFTLPIAGPGALEGSPPEALPERRATP